MANVELFCGDCLDILPTLPGPFDMILCDLPYGTTACKWDSVIPFEPLWEQYKRLIKRKGAVVLFGSQPFTSALVMSNVEWFKYEWVWRKTRPTGSLRCNSAPLKEHESVVMFSGCAPMYNPQMTPTKRVIEKTRTVNKGGVTGNHRITRTFDNRGMAYPRTIIDFPNPNHNTVHPTQKPVALLEYLIRTYTNEGETVLDNTMGSGSTGVAAVNTGRGFAGIELLPEYFAIAQQRIEAAQAEMVQLALDIRAETV